MQRLIRYGLMTVSWLFVAAVTSADVRILWDVSQSMVGNDPNNVRNTALIRLIDELPENERAAIWTFGQFVNLLVPHQPVNDAWRSQAREQMRSVQSVAVRTNIGAALEQAGYDFNFSSYRGPVDIILVTDGQVDISPNPDVNAVERARILGTVIPRFRAANARIHTIAISAHADQAFLRQISTQTGGQYYVISNADGLTRSLFAANQSRLGTAPATASTAPAAPPVAAASSDLVFTVVDSVRELTLLVPHSRASIQLQRPNGDISTAGNPRNDRWQVGSDYSQITISNPEVGQWQVLSGESDATRVSVFKDIRLAWQEPASMFAANGSTVTLSAVLLDRDDNVITALSERIGEIELTANGQPIAASIDASRIRARLLPRPNNTNVELALSVDVGTFTRSLSGRLRYVDAFNTELLLTEQAYEWRLYANRQVLAGGDLELQAVVAYQGRQWVEPFLESDLGYWYWQLPYDQPIGRYEVELTGSSVIDGRRTAVPSETRVLTLPVDPQLANAWTPDAVAGNEFSIPDLSQLEPELVVPAPGDEWIEQPPPAREGRSLLTYLLLSLPGIAMIAGVYLFYRRLESKSRASSSEDEMLLGGDEYAELDDIDNIAPDSDLDIGNISDDENEPPLMDDEFDDELPTPSMTEAPKANMDDLLEEVGTGMDDNIEAGSEVVVDDDEELFDISSIDDDLADLDLSLDGEDPFGDDLEEKK